ncbi:hypothetical protein [Leptolyngbya sp. 7M]|uniref:hypothetical protein n=1 Tax=Leptolyngbya sp. 7M TaxID=2812896 RepID=UPI001B8CD93B|nr:hypothetical protein [Leptolyngbya sp. 7M]QYO64177.1 hypothetical protein JVX88_31255 [Leptolyngbya sp. 7M]
MLAVSPHVISAIRKILLLQVRSQLIDGNPLLEASGEDDGERRGAHADLTPVNWTIGDIGRVGPQIEGLGTTSSRVWGTSASTRGPQARLVRGRGRRLRVGVRRKCAKGL